MKRGQNEQKDVLDSLRHNLQPRGMFTFGEVDVWMAGSGRSMDSSVLVIVGRTCGCRSALHLGVLADREIGWSQFLFFSGPAPKVGCAIGSKSDEQLKRKD